MSKPPPRLLDDPSASSFIKEDISKIRSASPRPFDLEAGLKRFQSSLQNQTSSSNSNVDNSTSFTQQPNPSYVSSSVTGLGGKIWMVMVLGAASIVAIISYVNYRYKNEGLHSDIGTNPGAISPAIKMSETAANTRILEGQSINQLQPNNLQLEDKSSNEKRDAIGNSEPAVKKPNSRKDKSEFPHKNQKAMPLNNAFLFRKKTAAAKPKRQELLSVGPSAQDEIDPDLRLREEIAQLAETRRRLSTDPLRALKLAKQGQKTFGNGMFVEEREAIIVFALDRLEKKAEMTERATRFLNRYPNGPFSERIRELLQEQNKASDMKKVGQQ